MDDNLHEYLKIKIKNIGQLTKTIQYLDSFRKIDIFIIYISTGVLSGKSVKFHYKKDLFNFLNKHNIFNFVDCYLFRDCLTIRTKVRFKSFKDLNAVDYTNRVKPYFKHIQPYNSDLKLKPIK